MLKIIIPYISKYKSTYQITDIIYLNRVLTYLTIQKITYEIINLNLSGYDIKALLKILGRRKAKVRNHLDSKENTTINKIIKRINQTLKLHSADTILYYHYFNKNLYTYLALLKEAKRLNKNIRIVCQGHRLFLTDTRILKKYPFIDVILSAHPGDAVSKICDNKNYKKIEGISYKLDGNIYRNNQPEIDLNRGPVVNQYLIEKKPKIIAVECASGCKYDCFFCENKGYEPYFQIKSTPNLIKEMQIAQKNKVKGVWFRDPAINFNEKHLIKFCDKIIKEDIKIYWSAPLIPSYMKLSTFKLMKNAGCIHLRLGVETLNKEIQERLNKGITVDSIRQNLKEIHKNGIKSSLGFMVGMLGETQSDEDDKIQFIEENKPLINSVKCYIFQLRKGSPAFRNPEEFGIIPITKIPENRKIRYKTNSAEWGDIVIKNKRNFQKFTVALKNMEIPEVIPERYFFKLILERALS